MIAVINIWYISAKPIINLIFKWNNNCRQKSMLFIDIWAHIQSFGHRLRSKALPLFGITFGDNCHSYQCLGPSLSLSLSLSLSISLSLFLSLSVCYADPNRAHIKCIAMICKAIESNAKPALKQRSRTRLNTTADQTIDSDSESKDDLWIGIE